MDPEEIVKEVLSRIRPTVEERAFVEGIMGELESIAWETIEELGLNAKPHFVGSLAKDTYLAGDHDVDLFLAFPPDTPVSKLREDGFELVKAIAGKLDDYEVSYAEHPYVRASYRGVSVDLVPCYEVSNWKEVRTAVDRSILHTGWVIENLKGRNDEVRLLKKFLKGINAYGSEVYVRGFSGYLAEVLIIEYGSFLEVLEKADFMLRKKVIDPGKWLAREYRLAMETVEREADRPLVVIDPVDPRRNVASNLGWERYGSFYFKAPLFLESPSESFFFPRERPKGSYLSELRRKGTHLVTLLFNEPGLVDDVLFPQLLRSARGLERALSKEGFNVLGWDFGRRDRAFIMLEIDRRERERIKLKPGPEFFTEQGWDFYRKNDRVWIVGKRLFAEKAVRENVVDVIAGLLERGQVALGKNLRESIARAEILLDYVPKELEEDAYLFLSREKWNLKG
ncbi:CCA-adding protein [Thermococcus sp. P6]|uniref:CCA tRNA nucleotidyltransferase n=1 Tax=Thermococcus sp. P6 TaxID=122420 RepID=UPI000B59C112|nr:CCA tRNA nucleotidyltransferase [Thermococcus sp. P6]ASJ10285.1 CCA-adding protein [Thermococcus sp. P6]